MVAARTQFLASLVSLFCCGAGAEGEIIGIEPFSYSNGVISGRSGGEGWSQSGGPSAWTGTATVSNGKLQTVSTAFTDTSATRSFGGDEATSALPTTTGVFVRFDLTFAAVMPDRSLLTLESQSGEPVSFGRFGQSWVIFRQGFTTGVSANVAAGSTHTILGGVDYQNDRFFLFVDPDSSDFYSRNGGTADVVVAYNGSDSIRRFTLGSISSQNAGVTWDNIGVTTTFEEAMQVPEPSALLLLLACLPLNFRRSQSSR